VTEGSTSYSSIVNTTISRLTTDRRFDPDSLRKISSQAIIKMSSNFHSSYISNCAHQVLNITTGRLAISIPLALLQDVRSTPFRIFDLRPVRLRNRCSDRVLFKSRGVPVIMVVGSIIEWREGASSYLLYRM
jgi:hypothetical protein